MDQICPKMDIGLQIQKTNLGIRISILQIPCVPTSRQNGQLRIFQPKYWILGSEFQKIKSRFRISTTKIPPVPILSQNGKFKFFDPNFEKLPNYVRYFGSSNVDVVAASWVEVGMSWVHSLVITFLKFCCKAIINWRFIICFRIL